MIADIQKDASTRMQSAVDHAREDLATIRTGRAHPAMFNRINADYYGAPTPLQQLAGLTIPEARMVLINPYDRGATDAIVRALRESDLGVNPTDDGQHIRVALPILTEERRKEYVKLAKTKAEDARISVRHERRKAMDALNKLKKDGDEGEDAVERGEKELEGLTKKYVELIDELLDAKETDLLEI